MTNLEFPLVSNGFWRIPGGLVEDQPQSDWPEPLPMSSGRRSGWPNSLNPKRSTPYSVQVSGAVAPIATLTLSLSLPHRHTQRHTGTLTHTDKLRATRNSGPALCAQMFWGQERKFFPLHLGSPPFLLNSL